MKFSGVGSILRRNRSPRSRSADDLAPGRIVKRSDGVDYFADFLDLVDLELVAMHDVQATASPCYYLRHDLCGRIDFDVVLRHAAIEAERGLTATYFLLTPGSYPTRPRNYYGWIEQGAIVHDDSLVEHCRALVDLGHDLGLHNDIVSLSLTTGTRPETLLRAEVEYFERHGLRLRGTAAHGQPLCRQLSYNNRELFQGCIRAGWEEARTIEHEGNAVRLHQLRLEDFGFEYEAYSLPRDSRISESGGRWGGRIAEIQLPREEVAENFDLAKFHSFIAGASAERGVRSFAILTHPCHWDVAA